MSNESSKFIFSNGVGFIMIWQVAWELRAPEVGAYFQKNWRKIFFFAQKIEKFLDRKSKFQNFIATSKMIFGTWCKYVFCSKSDSLFKKIYEKCEKWCLHFLSMIFTQKWRISEFEKRLFRGRKSNFLNFLAASKMIIAACGKKVSCSKSDYLSNEFSEIYEKWFLHFLSKIFDKNIGIRNLKKCKFQGRKIKISYFFSAFKNDYRRVR